MSDDLSKVDWGKPIEAYHVDGRVVTCSFLGDDGEDFLPMRIAGVPEDGAMATYQEGYFERDGTRSQSYWRIRNVAEPKGIISSETLPSDPIAKRMEALVRWVAEARDRMPITGEAQAIVALLDGPVDADLVEARKVVISMEDRPFYSWNIKAGEHDRDPLVQAALAAIKHTRALERDSREG